MHNLTSILVSGAMRRKADPLEKSGKAGFSLVRLADSNFGCVAGTGNTTYMLNQSDKDPNRDPASNFRCGSMIRSIKN